MTKAELEKLVDELLSALEAIVEFEEEANSLVEDEMIRRGEKVYQNAKKAIAKAKRH